MHRHFKFLHEGSTWGCQKIWVTIFVFYCIFMIQFFEVFWGGTWGALRPPLPPLCAFMNTLLKSLKGPIFFEIIVFIEKKIYWIFNKNILKIVQKPTAFTMHMETPEDRYSGV